MPKKNESAAEPAVSKTRTKKKCAPAVEKPASAKSSLGKTKRAGTKKNTSTKTASAKKSLDEPKKPRAKKTKSPALKPGHGMDLVQRCVKALDDKKASKIEVIYVGENSSVTDYFIIATGTSDPHLRALRVELEKAIDAVVPEGNVRVQNEPNSGWCVVDAFDVVVHIFSAEQRANYDLEKLYSAGKRIEIDNLI